MDRNGLLLRGGDAIWLSATTINGLRAIRLQTRCGVRAGVWSLKVLQHKRFEPSIDTALHLSKLQKVG